jgi:hypothetical protein
MISQLSGIAPIPEDASSAAAQLQFSHRPFGPQPLLNALKQARIKRSKEHLMNISQSAKQVITLMLIFLAAFAPLTEQASVRACASSQQSEADEDGVTFDNLLSASSYSLYFEARNIGQQTRIGGLSEIVEPLAPVMGQLSGAIDLVARFLAANADALSHSRLMIAAEPAKNSLPPVLAALELDSADAAQEFQGKIQELLVSVLSPDGIAASDANKKAEALQQSSAMPSMIRRAGRLLVFSPTPFTFKSLKREGDKPISDDPNFRAAHDRFYSETLFLYYDAALSMRALRDRMEGAQKEMEAERTLQKEHEAQGNSSTRSKDSSSRTPPPEPASPGTPLAVNQALPPVETSPPQPIAESLGAESSGAESSGVKSPVAQSEPRPDKRLAGAPAAPPSTAAKAASPASTPSKPARASMSPGRRAGESPKTNLAISAAPAPPISDNAQSRSGGSDQLGNFLQMMLTRGLSSLPSPDAIALALTLENDSLILRALAVAHEQMSFGPIPFLPILISGPALASGAANYLPADTDIFIAASLDLSQLYDKILEIESSFSSRAMGSKEPSFESKAAAFEKANGFKIRDQIAATLGNEVAVGLPARYLSQTPLGRMPLSARATQSGPVVLISVRDKAALQSKLRPALEALGLKSPNEKGTMEKRGDIEINSYAQITTAFIDNYLVFASDAATIRRLLDARAKNETLATSRDFHGYMQWQPRETLAQAYISGAILKDLFKSVAAGDVGFDEESKQLLARYSFEPEPISYLAATDVLGPLYELRIPKKLLMRAFAQIAAEEMRSRLPRNEITARSMLLSFHRLEQTYKIDRGRYGELEELSSFRFGIDYMQKIGYKFDLMVSGNAYEATATPIEYGKTGRLSFYIDQSGEMREGDHGGRRATIADKKSSENN